VSVAARRCGACGRVLFEEAGACPHCGGPLAPAALSGRGRIYSFTRVHLGLKGLSAPYHLALVELEGDGRVLGRLETPEGGEPAVGERVVFWGLTDQGPCFRREPPAERREG